MTPEFSRVSFHQRDPSSDILRRDLPSQHDQEIPATAPIFEGHLHWQTKKKTWERRLFRFDGTSFTCLSTRKVKLPPNTVVDPAQAPPNFLHTSPSFATSFTSPLLATPKNKILRLTSMTADTPYEPVLASYYQLPKWTVDMSNIAEVSIVKSQKKSYPLSGRSKSNRFCIRTFDGECYVLKAQKQKDLERWLFVLVKMWNFAQAIHKQSMARQSLPPLPHIHSPSQHPSLASPPRTPQQPFYRSSPYPNLSYPSALDAQDNLPLLHSVPPAQQYDSCAQPRMPAHDKSYPNPTLSNEKLEWIDEWRRSLAELVAQDPNIKVSPPPIEPIPDDDKMSVTSGMTSVSNRHRRPEPVPPQKISTFQPLRRRASKRSTRSSSQRRHTKAGAIAPQEAAPERPALRKKRSDNVKHWIVPHHSKDSDDEDEEEGDQDQDEDESDEDLDTKNTHPRGDTQVPVRRVSVRQSSGRPVARPGSKPTIQRFSALGTSSSPEILHLDYFQDVMSSDSPDAVQSGSVHSQQIHYNDSVRARKVQVEHASAHESTTSGNPVMRTGAIHKRASAPLDGDRWTTLRTQQAMLGEQQIHALSPPQAVERVEQDEEMSLADLQKSLKKVNLHSTWAHARSPSASSILDNYRHPVHTYDSHASPSPRHSHTQRPLPPLPNISPLVAPAVPPVSVTSTSLPGFFTRHREPKKDKADPWMSRSHLLKSASADGASQLKDRPQSMILTSHSGSLVQEKRTLSGSSSRLSIDRLTDSARSGFRRWI